MSITRTVIVDDDGTARTGTPLNNAWKQELYDQIDASMKALDDTGDLSLVAATTLTLASDAITVTLNQHKVDTEGGAASDNLSTITAGTSVRSGHLLILQPANVAHVVTVKDNVGNVKLAGGDFAMNNANHRLALLYDGTNWTEIARAAGAVAATGPTVQTTTATGTQNDFGVTGARHLILRCNNASLLTFTGFAAGSDGDEIDVVSIGAGQVDLPHQNAGSAAANRFINLATSAPSSLAAGSGTARYVYDGTTARWRLVAHEQGAWITPTFAAGNFTGSASMTWTVGAGDVVAYCYSLSGRRLSIRISLVTTTIGGTPAGELRAVIPGGFTAAGGYEYKPVTVNDNGAGYAAGAMSVDSTAAFVRFWKATTLTGNWAASTNLTEVYGSLTFEVA